MGRILYIIAMILIIGWAITFLGGIAGGLIHLLLVVAVILIIINVFKGKETNV